MYRINVFKVFDETISETRYELWKNGSFYTSNVSRELKDSYIANFRKQGYTIFNGVTIFDTGVYV